MGLPCAPNAHRVGVAAPARRWSVLDERTQGRPFLRHVYGDWRRPEGPLCCLLPSVRFRRGDDDVPASWRQDKQRVEAFRPRGEIPPVERHPAQQHAAKATYRSAANDAPKAAGRASGGPISGYLTVSRNKVMSSVQAHPRHVRFVLMLFTTLSPFAMSGNAYLLEFVRGLGVPYSTPSPSGVRDVLLEVFLFIYDRLWDDVRQLLGRYRGLPFFHLVTDLWTERHGSGSYGSLVLRCVNPDGFVMRELHFCFTLFSGRHDHKTIDKWLLQQLARFGARPQDISSFTTDSGSNVKKALRQLWPRLNPCGADAIHLAFRAALGATTESAAARDARTDAATTPRTGSRNPAASELLGRTRKTAAHFHKSPASVSMLNSAPLAGDDCAGKLLTECPTRWGSTYLFLV